MRFFFTFFLRSWGLISVVDPVGTMWPTHATQIRSGRSWWLRRRKTSSSSSSSSSSSFSSSFLPQFVSNFDLSAAAAAVASKHGTEKKKKQFFFSKKKFFLVNRYRKCIVSLLWTQLCIFISDLLNIIFLHLNKKMAEFNPYLKKEISCNEHSLFERLF